MGTQRNKPGIAYTLILRRFPLESNVLAAKECFLCANGAQVHWALDTRTACCLHRQERASIAHRLKIINIVGARPNLPKISLPMRRVQIHPGIKLTFEGLPGEKSPLGVT